MSYDLSFDVGAGFNKKSFAAYFRQRRNYEVANEQAIYQNENTGVYFIFDAPEDGVVSFNLNFYRPHVFGLEAAIELEAFARATGAAATDEAGDLGSGGSFETQKFLRNWNEGNRFACKVMAKDMDRVYTWPARRIREIWDWNYSRPAEDEFEEGDVFVPGIFAIEENNQAISVAVWPPHCPILLPQVDAVLVPINIDDEDCDAAKVPWEELAALVKPYQESAAGIARYRMALDPWPAAIDAFFAKRRQAMKPNGISMDQVLDRELVGV